MGFDKENKKYFVEENNNSYKFDLDLNGVLALTERNVERIDFLIANDSKYRQSTSDDPIETFCNKYPYFWCKNEAYDRPPEDLTKELVTIVDKANSTHQSSEGPNVKKGEHDGRGKTAKYIIDNCSNLGERLESGDPELVDEIACSLLGEDDKERYTFSFASKFCTYVSRGLFPASDNYSIYDNVVRMALPYYACVYLDEELPMRKGRCVKDPYSKFGEKEHRDESKWKYKEYAGLIKRIIDENEKKTGYRISRKDFDHLLWYYFKGENSRIEESRNRISEKERKESRDKFRNSRDYIH